MTNLKKPKSRFAAIKEFAKRRKKRKTPINRRDYGHSGMAGMFAPNSSTRKRLERESPIASLKLLHEAQRKVTADTIVISDEESGVQGGISDNDEDLSDSSNDMSLRNHDLLVRHKQNSHKVPRPHRHESTPGDIGPDIDEHTELMQHIDAQDLDHHRSEKRTRGAPGANAKKLLHEKFVVPDIVIDDTSLTVGTLNTEKLPCTAKVENSEHVVGFINSHGEDNKQDNIMWL